MGSQPCRHRIQAFDKANQIPSRLETRSTLEKSRVFDRISFKSSGWSQDQIFQFDSNVEDYSSIWDENTKLLPNFQQAIQTNQRKIEHHHRENLNNKRTTKNSTVSNSAHIESTVDTQTEASIHLSSSEKFDEFINNLNKIHSELDEIIKHRTEQISNETELILQHIQNETESKQQHLLTYIKNQQLKNDENYRKLLEEYLVKLDQIKVQDLSQLEKQFEDYREKIFEESQLKILTVNHQANSIKEKILRNEQQKAAEKIDTTIAKLNQLFTNDQFQSFGSESITRTQIITNANIGTTILSNEDQILNNRKTKKNS